MTIARGPKKLVGRHPAHLMFFRYGEVSVLFQGETPEADPADLHLEKIREAFAGAGVRLAEGRAASLQRGGRRSREAVRSRDPNGLPLVFQTVNLDSWKPELDQLNDVARHNPKLDDAIRDVPPAVRTLLDADIKVGGWRVLGASPNWTAVSFCDVDGGGPGGRPVPATEIRRFRRFGRPDNVRAAVASCMSANVSEEVRGKTRIAILDTWPMDREEGLEIGERPKRPLDRIRRFLSDNQDKPAIAGNDFLQAAALGHIVHPDNIFDYVSWQQPSDITTAHFNWDTMRHEPGYDMSDHGLFIAGMIKDIAPDAEISVYRVLADDGSGDLEMVVRAIRDAIDAAGGEPLVINMSLGFAPPLTTIVDLLCLDERGGGQNAVDVQDAGRWRTLLETKAKEAQEHADDPYYYAKALAEAGLAELDGQGRVARFRDVLTLVQYLFDLPEKDRVLISASAGNDSTSRFPPFPPRLPASVNGILGVSATRAWYSNLDDVEPIRDDGLSAFGGLAEADDQTDTTHTTPGQGIVGMAIAETLPPEWDNALQAVAVPNETGWAEWAGTSFAAPIASGLAACIWGENPGLDAAAVMDMLVNSTGNHSIGLIQQPE